MKVLDQYFCGYNENFKMDNDYLISIEWLPFRKGNTNRLKCFINNSHGEPVFNDYIYIYRDYDVKTNKNILVIDFNNKCNTVNITSKQYNKPNKNYYLSKIINTVIKNIQKGEI